MSALIIWNCLEALLAAAGEGQEALGGCSCCEGKERPSEAGTAVGWAADLVLRCYPMGFCSHSFPIAPYLRPWKDSVLQDHIFVLVTAGASTHLCSLVALRFLCPSLLAVLIIASSSSQPQPCPAFLRELWQVKSQTCSSYVFKSYWNMVSVWRGELSTT